MTGHSFAFLLLAVSETWGVGSAWNSLNASMDTADEARVVLEEPESVDLGTLLPSDVLIVVEPESPLPHAELREFVREGGAMVLFGESRYTQDFLVDYGLEMKNPPLDHKAFFRGDRDFPRFRSGDDEALFFNMDSPQSQLTGNHPMSFRLSSMDRRRCLVPYEGVSGLCFVGLVRSGRGHIVAVADASVVIAEMQALHGNKQFLANVLRRYCVAEPCKAIWVSPESSWTGAFRSSTWMRFWTEIQQLIVGYLNDRVKMRWLAGGGLLVAVLTLFGFVHRAKMQSGRVALAQRRVLRMRENARKRRVL